MDGWELNLFDILMEGNPPSFELAPAIPAGWRIHPAGTWRRGSSGSAAGARSTVITAQEDALPRQGRGRHGQRDNRGVGERDHLPEK